MLVLLGVIWFSIPARADLKIPAVSYTSAEGFAPEHGPGNNFEPSSEGGQNVGWVKTGTTLTYEIDLSKSASYIIRLRVAAKTKGKVHFELDSGAYKSDIQTFTTRGYQKWMNVSFPPVEIKGGKHRLTVVSDLGIFNFLSIEIGEAGEKTAPVSVAVVKPTTAPTVAPTTVPTTAPTDAPNPKKVSVPPIRIQASQYSSSLNFNRPGRRPNLSDIYDNDAFDYDFSVAVEGNYTLSIKVSSVGTGIVNYVLDRGTYASPARTVASGGRWTIMTFPAIQLKKGRHSIRIISIDGGFKYEFFEFTYQ
ncbi:MAG: carbohydrate-binding protein [Bdellovibrionia bacterium]